MKKLLFALTIMVTLSTGINAQNGNMWIGGSTGVTSSKVKDGNKLTNYNLVPEVGYNLSDNFGIGLKVGYLHKEYEEMNNKVKSNGFTVNPFARYSFLKGDIGGLFVDGGVGYSYRKIKSTNTKVNELEIGFRPGVSLNVSKNLALTGKFGFIGYQYEKFGPKKTNTFGFDFDLSQIQLGLNFVF